jgi:hypothetical protein
MNYFGCEADNFLQSSQSIWIRKVPVKVNDVGMNNSFFKDIVPLQ